MVSAKDKQNPSGACQSTSRAHRWHADLEIGGLSSVFSYLATFTMCSTSVSSCPYVLERRIRFRRSQQSVMRRGDQQTLEPLRLIRASSSPLLPTAVHCRLGCPGTRAHRRHAQTALDAHAVADSSQHLGRSTRLALACSCIGNLSGSVRFNDAVKLPFGRCQAGLYVTISKGKKKTKKRRFPSGSSVISSEQGQP